MSPWKMTLPEFSNDEITSPDGEFVSALASASVPNCNPKGSGSPVGKLLQYQISGDADDGSWNYGGTFLGQEVAFGTNVPAV